MKRHKWISRSKPLRKKRSRRVERMRPCVGRRSFGGGMSGVQPHRCDGPIQQSHGRNLDGVTGLGLKPNDLVSVPMCAGLHAQWEQRRGHFEGWDKEERRTWFLERIVEENAAFRMNRLDDCADCA